MTRSLGRLALAAGLLATTSLPALAQDAVSFQLDWVPGGDKAHVYAGVREGFFAEEGIELTILSGSGSTDAITKVATGVADFGTTDIGALMAGIVETDVPVVAIMSIFTQGPHAIFTTADTGIESLTDVTGRTVATAPFSSSNVFWPLVLSDNGVDPGSVTVINADPPALGPMLMTGQVDASIAWITNLSLMGALADEAGKELVMIPWADYGLGTYATTLITSDTMIEENPELVERFLRAMSRSVQFMHDNPRAAAEALAEMVPEVDVDVVEGQVNSALALMFNEATDAAGLGGFDPVLLAGSWSWVARAQGYDEAVLEPESIVTRDFLPE